MVHWLKLGTLLVGASILSGCVISTPGGDVEDEEATNDGSQGLLGEARVILNDSTSSCVTRPGTTDGMPLNVSACSSGGNQHWTVRARGNGLFEIVANGTEQCVAIEGSSKLDGAHGVQLPCTGTNEQLFRIDTAPINHARFLNMNSGKCIDLQVQPGTGIRQIVQWRCGESPSQRWTQQ